MIRRVLFPSLCLLVLGGCGFLGGDRNAGQGSVAPGINDRYATADGRASAVQIFEGEGREKYQKPDEVIRQMDLAPGDVVCEVGAGSGYFTPYLSKAVGSTGKVYAEDPQPEFLELLKQKKEKQGLENVEIVLGTYTDTNLPDGDCDVTFVLDAYHHFEWPKTMLDAMKRDTRRDGRLVIVDWYRRQNPIFDMWKIDALKHLRLDVDGVIAEIESHGWKHADTRRFLDHQFLAVFTPR
jgi:ubiquinone/menaquinone biosynthesis C-methylase UbiE